MNGTHIAYKIVKNSQIVGGVNMKKMFLTMCLVVTMMFVTVPVGADTLITPVPGATYTNPTDALPNSNPETEQMFLADILGLLTTDPSLAFIWKEDSGVAGSYFDGVDIKSLDDWLPAGVDVSGWLYAVVKVDGPNDGWYAYQRTDSDGLGLTVPEGGLLYRYGISHVSFFGSTPVPEPATLLLLGLGLVGVAGIRRKLQK
jgi:hypothetical protein